MPRDTVPIKTLLLRIFVPAVVLVSLVLAVFVYNRLYTTIIGGFDRKLTTTSALAGALIDPEDHDRLIRAALVKSDAEQFEKTPLYLRNVAPIRDIRSKLGLTYLYSQVVRGPEGVTYILDGSEGDEHSPIGSDDELSAMTMRGVANAESKGTIFVSPIEYQEQWGLLKTAIAPVYGKNGRITSTAGADVNISVIQIATQNSLFTSALIGIGSILVCLLVALMIVRRIGVPIEVLKDDALKFAAGDGRVSSSDGAPHEVARLRDALGTLAEKMANATTSREAAKAQYEDDVTAAKLLDAAGLNIDRPVQFVERDSTRIFWIAVGNRKIEMALAARSMVRLAERLRDQPDLAEHWLDLVDSDHGICLVVDDRHRLIKLVGEAPVTVRWESEELSLSPEAPVAFDAEASLVRIAGGQYQSLAKEARQ